MMTPAKAGWVGAAAVSAAPFLIDTTPGKMLAILGSLLLGYQAYHARTFNVLTLNLVGIVGYTYAIFH